jgi:glycosyltransferase involved in cell wall biosynthesis
MFPSISVVITTKNRFSELRRALESVLKQDIPVDILVFDDGSTDGTSKLVADAFPTVRVHRVERSLGIVNARNAAIPMGKADIVVTIDDDCILPEADILRRTLQDFDSSDIGAVAIPFVTPRLPPTPAGDPTSAVAHFTGCANAIRKDLFNKLRGYQSVLVRQGEEYDFCLRMLAAGYFTRHGSSSPIIHDESVIRNMSHQCFHGTRSSILINVLDIPLIYLVPQTASNIVRHMISSSSVGCPGSAMRGVFSGIRAATKEWRNRKPVPMWAFRLMRRLRTRGSLPIAEVREIILRNHPVNEPHSRGALQSKSGSAYE